MEPLVLVGRALPKAPWRLSVVPGRTVVLADHGFPELAGVTVTDASTAERPDAPMVATYAEGAPRLTRENVFAVGKVKLEVFAYRAWGGRPSRPISVPVLEALRAMRAKDSTARRLVLADVLEEDGGAREAEYVRKELQLATLYDPRGPEALGQLKAFVALSAEVGTTFRVLVARDVDGCAGPKWTLRCPRQWHELPKTDDPRLAFCERCVKPLAIAASEEEAQAIAAGGACVSYTNYTGAPD